MGTCTLRLFQNFETCIVEYILINIIIILINKLGLKDIYYVTSNASFFKFVK
jgi:hypothetical protein